MDAREVRLGNYVYNTKGEADTIDIDAIKYLLQYPYPHCQVRPILISEEILLKCGFKKTPANNSYYLPIPELKAEIHFEIFRGGLVCVLYCSTGSFIPNDIKYLHQLQNLYFTITGKELPINL